MALIDIIKAANLDRQAPLLKKKYNFMRKDAFLFFRCTPELYYSHLAADSFLFNAPHAWICGDLHLAFGAAFNEWGAAVIAFAKEAADQVFSDYAAYNQAYDAQEFEV